MMKNRPGEKIKLASLDELLGVVNEESAMEIEINKIHAFKNHPFKVLDDEKMQDLIESVKLSGVLTPVLLRVDSNDEYEMISGHRRLHAAKMAGLTTIPAIVRKLSDDDAVIAMVDANIQGFFDSNNELMAVTVVKNENGDKVSKVSFKNSYTGQNGKNQNPVPSSPRSKDIIHNGSPVKTGDDSPVAGYLFLFFGSVICLCGLLMEKQKNRKEDAKNEA